MKRLGTLAILTAACLCPLYARAAGIPVSGRVLGPGGTSLPKAKVRLLPEVGPVATARMENEGKQPAAAAQAITDASGAFGLEAPHAGLWRVCVEAPGYVAMERALRPLVEGIDLPDVTLEADAGLTVRVNGSDAAPLKGARVRLAAPHSALRFAAEGWRVASRTALAGDDGVARLPRAADEKSVLTASAPGHLFLQRREVRGTGASLRLERAAAADVTSSATEAGGEEAVDSAVRKAGASGAAPASGLPSARESQARQIPRPPRLERIEVVSAAGFPAAGVLVLAADGEHPLGFTDARGLFEVVVSARGETPITLIAEDGRLLETRLRASEARFAAARGGAKAADDKPRRLTLPGRLAVSGLVIDAGSRAPVAGAFVWNDREVWGGAVTDASGVFTLSGPEEESVEIEAAAPGYLPGAPLAALFRKGSSYGRTIPLRPATSVEGIVVDAAGRPVAGAQVRVKEHEEDSGQMRISIGGPDLSARTVTSSKGRFRLSPVDPAKSWDLRAEAKGFAPAVREVGGLEARRPLTGLRVELAAARKAIGIVRDAEHRPIPGVEATLRPAVPAAGPGGRRVMLGGPPPEEFTASTDGEGRFVVTGIGGGRFDLTLRRAGYARTTVPGIDVARAEGGGPAARATTNGSNAVAARRDAVLGEFAMERGERIDGLVSGEDGAPLEGVKVRMRPGSGGLLALVTPSGMPGTGGDEPPPDGVTGSDGRFAVEGLRPGEPVSLSFEREGYVDARESGIVRPRAEPLEIVMHPASKVSGRVVDSGGKPIPRAQVGMTRRKSADMGGNSIILTTRQDARADGEGVFVFENVDPGKVSLKAVAPGWQEVRLDGVEVPMGKDVEGIEISLRRGAAVEGRVFTPDGRPAVAAYVSPSGEERSEPEGVATDGDGRYRIEGLAPGRVSIEATHESWPRVVKDLDAKPGENALDLQFEGGQSVSGIVVDAAGRPIPGAWLRLEPAGGGWNSGGVEASSRADGSFLFEGVTDGGFTLAAGRSGWATSRGTRVEVAGKPVEALRVTLEEGGAIAGSVSGIDPADYAQVEVRAWGEAEGSERATLDRQGNFRFESLSAGTWNVLGSVGTTGRQARTRAVVAAGGEAHVSLEFGQGLTLSGRALVGEIPLRGATIFAQGTDVNRTGWSRTDEAGTFRIEGLEKGTYRLELRQWETGVSHDETVDLPASREIVVRVPTARIAGIARDALDRKPLSGVSVTLARASGGEGASRDFEMERAATTDLAGRFEIGNVPDGSWRVTASRRGYAAASADAEVVNGHDAEALILDLDPTEGLMLEVRLASGRQPDQVQVAVLDPTGAPLTSGTFASGEGGSVRLSTVPAGTWDLIVGAGGSAAVGLRATAPGPPVPVMLPPACRVEVIVPELASSSVAAWATVSTPDGRPFRALGWGADPVSRWRLSAGRVELDSLPPGPWRVRVEASDGRSWTGAPTAAPDAQATLRLEGR